MSSSENVDPLRTIALLLAVRKNMVNAVRGPFHWDSKQNFSRSLDMRLSSIVSNIFSGSQDGLYPHNPLSSAIFNPVPFRMWYPMPRKVWDSLMIIWRQPKKYPRDLRPSSSGTIVTFWRTDWAATLEPTITEWYGNSSRQIFTRPTRWSEVSSGTGGKRMIPTSSVSVPDEQLWPSLLSSLILNLNHQVKSFFFFFNNKRFKI